MFSLRAIGINRNSEITPNIPPFRVVVYGTLATCLSGIGFNVVRILKNETVTQLTQKALSYLGTNTATLFNDPILFIGLSLNMMGQVYLYERVTNYACKKLIAQYPERSAAAPQLRDLELAPLMAPRALNRQICNQIKRIFVTSNTELVMTGLMAFIISLNVVDELHPPVTQPFAASIQIAGESLISTLTLLGLTLIYKKQASDDFLYGRHLRTAI